MVPNVLYVGAAAIIGFAVGFFIISFPGIRNRMKKKNKRFSEKEMMELTDYRKKNFASDNAEYSKVQTHL